MKYVVNVQDQQLHFDYSENDGQISLKNKGSVEYDLQDLGNGCYSLLVNGKSYVLHVSQNSEGYQVLLHSQPFTVHVQDEQSLFLDQLVKTHKSEPQEQVIKAPIPGLVTQVFARPETEVEKDTALLTLEAMKMENVIKAPCNCEIEKVFVKAGETVQQNQPLIQLKRKA